MKTAICYHSSHHGNTRKVVEAMAEGNAVTLIDVAHAAEVDLTGYDCIGFASGIYRGKFHPAVVDFARRHLPEGKPVFFVCTYGSGGHTRTIAEAADEKHAILLGEFGCRGYDTFGPFKLVGGIAKGHPDEADLQQARIFYQQLAGGAP